MILCAPADAQQEGGILQIPLDAGAAGPATEIQRELAAGRLDAAGEKAGALLRSKPGNYEGHYWSGMVAVARGDHHAAIRALRRAEALEPNPTVLKGLGLAYYLARQYRLFELKMKEASAKDPKDFAPYYFLGRYQDENSHFPKAAEYFSKAIELNPNHFPSHYYLGYAYEAQNDLAQAEKQYQLSLELSKKSGRAFPLAYLGLARLRVAAGDAAGAVPLAEEAVRLKSNDPAVHKFLGSTFLALGRDRDAIREWETTARLDPNDGQVQYQLAQAYRKVGDSQKAEAALARFKRINAAYGN